MSERMSCKFLLEQKVIDWISELKSNLPCLPSLSLPCISHVLSLSLSPLSSPCHLAVDIHNEVVGRKQSLCPSAELEDVIANQSPHHLSSSAPTHQTWRDTLQEASLTPLSLSLCTCQSLAIRATSVCPKRPVSLTCRSLAESWMLSPFKWAWD